MKIQIKNKNSTYNKGLKETKKGLNKASEIIYKLENEERGTLVEIAEDIKIHRLALQSNVKQVVADIKLYKELLTNISFETAGLSFVLRKHTGAYKHSRIALKPVIEAARKVVKILDDKKRIKKNKK